MNALEHIDRLIIEIAEQSEHVAGFVRELDEPVWTLLFGDDLWIDIEVGDEGLMSITTEIGSVADPLASNKLNGLMLSYAGFNPDTAFSMTAEGVRRLRQFLPRNALEQAGFKTLLEGFAAKAQAWRELLRTPASATPAAAHAEPQLSDMPLRG